MSIFTPNDVSIEMLNIDKKTQQNAKVTNSNGSVSFGLMPNLNNNLPQGEVILKLGYKGFYNPREKESKGAFGLRHIWDKHRAEINAKSASDIILFIEEVMIPGADIIIDKKKSLEKPLIVESSTGMVIVALKRPLGEDAYYHVVTAYDRKSHPGILVGNL